MRLMLVAGLVVVGTVGVARADDGARIAAAKAQLAAQAKAIGAHADPALAATFAPDPVVSYGGEPSTGGLDDGWGDQVPQKVVLGDTQIGWSGTWGWIAAEATITVRAKEPGAKARTAPYHWMALLVADGTGVKTKALAIVEAVPDRQLEAASYVSSLPELDKPEPLTALLGDPVALAAHLGADAAATVFGSSSTDRGLGGPAAKRLLAGWRKLRLELVTREPAGGQPIEATVGDVRFAFATVKLVPQLVALSVFAIARKHGDGWQVVAVQYGAIDIKR